MHLLDERIRAEMEDFKSTNEPKRPSISSWQLWSPVTVKSNRIPRSDGGNLFGQGEDDVEVFSIEEFGSTVLDPLGASQRLTLWAMPASTANGEISLSCLMGIFLLGSRTAKGRARHGTTPF